MGLVRLGLVRLGLVRLGQKGKMRPFKIHSSEEGSVVKTRSPHGEHHCGSPYFVWLIFFFPE